eukprot:g17994.t1
MGGELEGRRGEPFSPSRDRGSRGGPAGQAGEASFFSPTSTSYGSAGMPEVSAPFVAQEKGAARRKRQRQRQQPPGEESSLLRRSLASIGVLALFAFAVTTVNNRRLEIRRLRATGVQTSFVRITHQGNGADMAPMAPMAALTVTATNEYGAYSDAALDLYGLEMVVEPHRATTLTATPPLVGVASRVDGEDSDAASSVAPTFFVWRLVEVELDLDHQGRPVDTGVDVEVKVKNEVFFDGNAGRQVSVELTKPGGVFQLTVEERLGSGGADGVGDGRGGQAVVAARATVTISCRYVRRELRELTDTDLKDVLDAMQVYYTVSTDEGKAKYGENFFNYKLLTAYHNADLSRFCYHAGLQFLTAHAAFGLMMERSLQAVNPRVSLPFWDYMIEAETLGTEWMDSPIFDADMFGRAMGSAENGYQLTEGRFANIATILDAENNLPGLHCQHNAYGYLGPTFSYQNLPVLTRASSYCNLRAHAVFATSDVLFGCFTEYDTWSDWEFCMERRVHGDIHAVLGGAFDCNVDMRLFHEEHPEFSPGLLSFVLEYLTGKYWPGNSFLPQSNVCDTECEIGQSEPCGCTCSIDAMTLSEDEVYSLTSGFISSAANRYAGDEFVSFDESSDRPWGFKQDGVRLDDDSTMLLLRYVVKLGCEPSAVGSMVGGISPQDPLFFVLHPIFEKGLHVLWMSPRFRDSYSFEWEDGACNGSKLDDFLPFSERDLGMGTGTDFLTNRDLVSHLHASNPRLPYVFDNFAKWGTVDDWDFCPECTATAAGAAAAAGA